MGDDTVKLLRECNAGIKMGVSSLDDVLPHAKDPRLKQLLTTSKDTHCRLGDETHKYLEKYQDDGKEPAMMAKVMSKVKTNVKLGGEDSDRVIADLITDGCNMGVKSLYRYKHQYPAADSASIKLTESIIEEEEHLIRDLRDYL